MGRVSETRESSPESDDKITSKHTVVSKRKLFTAQDGHFIKRCFVIVLAVCAAALFCYELIKPRSYSECYLDGIKNLSEAKMYSLVEKTCRSTSNPDPLDSKLNQNEFDLVHVRAFESESELHKNKRVVYAAVYNGNSSMQLSTVDFVLMYKRLAWGKNNSLDKNNLYTKETYRKVYRIKEIVPPLSYRAFNFETEETDMPAIIKVVDIKAVNIYGKKVGHL